MHPVWIVDDDSSIRWVLEKALSKHNVGCKLFESAADVLLALQQDLPKVLISDIRMPGNSGLHLLEQVKSKYPSLPVIIMTAFSDLDSAVSSFQGGAYEYLSKPFDVSSAVELITKVLSDSFSDRSFGKAEASDFENLLGQGSKMQEVFRAIGKLSQSSTSVLVTGETGTGKELIAKALHRHSPRSKAPFIALNMAAIPKDLMESELFGHERGSFTGALTSRKGRFEQAQGGTLFLDEIGDMPIDLQTRLLRVLSEGKFFRVGGITPLESDVRVITATHQDLESRVNKKLFREDLFHRINVFRIKLPPLRDRKEDIYLLADHFLEKCASNLKIEKKLLSESANKLLENFNYPGNVRQLENICHWLTVMAPGKLIEPTDLPTDIQDYHYSKVKNFDKNIDNVDLLKEEWREALKRDLENVFMNSSVKPNAAYYQFWLNEFDKVIFSIALEFSRGKRIDCSRLLNVGRNTVTRKIQDLKLPF